MSTPVGEVLAAEAAYRALSGLESHEQDRAMAWIKSRMDTDQRGREARQYPEIEPTDWIVGGHVEGASYPSRDGCAADELDFTVGILEVIGRAPVRQHFAVLVPVDDGREVEWFDDREKAEAYLAAMNAPDAYSEDAADPDKGIAMNDDPGM